MSGFEDRERSFESKYAHEEKLGFETEAKCCKLFGLWAAAELGLEGDNAKIYAMEVVESNLEEAGFEDVFRKVRADFDQKNLDVSDHVMRVEMDKCLAEARRIIAEGA